MSLAIVFEEVARVTCAHDPQSWKSTDEKKILMKIYPETHHTSELIIGMD